MASSGTIAVVTAVVATPAVIQISLGLPAPQNLAWGLTKRALATHQQRRRVWSRMAIGTIAVIQISLSLPAPQNLTWGLTERAPVTRQQRRRLGSRMASSGTIAVKAAVVATPVAAEEATLRRRNNVIPLAMPAL
jgi:hypothetical protein